MCWPLEEAEATIGTIPVNLHAQELSGGSQISQFEVLRQLHQRWCQDVHACVCG